MGTGKPAVFPIVPRRPDLEDCEEHVWAHGRDQRKPYGHAPVGYAVRHGFRFAVPLGWYVFAHVFESSRARGKNTRPVVIDVGLVPLPAQNRLVVGAPQDFLLQAQERTLPLAIDQGHVDIKDAQHRISHVLGPRRDALRHPGHSPGDAGPPNRPRAYQVHFRYTRGLRQRGFQFRFGSETFPVRREEDDSSGCQEFLQRPAPREPSAAQEDVVGDPFTGFMNPTDHPVWHVDEVNVTNFSVPIPRKHGIDGLGQLGTARLVDAVRVDPKVFEFVLQRLRAGPADLSKPCLCNRALQNALPVLERHFLISPGVGKDGVWRDALPDEFSEFERCRVDKPHCR